VDFSLSVFFRFPPFDSCKKCVKARVMYFASLSCLVVLFDAVGGVGDDVNGCVGW
jgi:hypothetical protein